MSIFVAGSLAMGLILYAKPQVNCDRKLLPAMVRPFQHGDLGHLVANLFAFYMLSNSIQPRIGASKYLMLIGFLWITTVLMDLAFKQHCSIGFSGIVLGLLVWDLFDRGSLKFDLAAFAALAVVWLQPMLTGQQNVSMSGHLYGILAGLIAVMLTKAWKKNATDLVK